MRRRWRYSWLAAYRHAHGLSQSKAVARYIAVIKDPGAGMDVSRLSHLERWPLAGGRFRPTASLLIDFAQVYETEPENLIDAEHVKLLAPHDQRRLTTRSLPRVEVDPVRAAATDARQIGDWVTSSRIPQHTLAGYRDALAATSADFLRRPAGELFGELVQLRDEVFRDLRQGRRQTGDLFALLGMVAVVLAHASHLLGRSREGMTQARLALVCADEADHVELGAWACGTQALLAECTGRLRDAREYVCIARDRLQRSRVPGSAAVRLACYEARILARMSRADSGVLAALAAADEARERLHASIDEADMDTIAGILTFPEPKAMMYAGAVCNLIGDTRAAEQHAQDAVQAYLSGPPELLSYGDLALARIDIAAARLNAGDLDGVKSAIERVVALPSALRIEPLRAPLSALSTQLQAPPYRRATTAADIRNTIAAFTRPSSEVSR
jgi:transcriptional regulator with XRE-family HTH domain